MNGTTYKNFQIYNNIICKFVFFDLKWNGTLGGGPGLAATKIMPVHCCQLCKLFFVGRNMLSPYMCIIINYLGIETYEYIADKNMFGNGTVNPENKVQYLSLCNFFLNCEAHR